MNKSVWEGWAAEGRPLAVSGSVTDWEMEVFRRKTIDKKRVNEADKRLDG
jgi:hypothetical protein